VPTGFDAILQRLADRDLILPYFESGLLADQWPDEYVIKIDSRPYYGLDEDGKPDGYFHPSSHALLGERELYYRFHPDTRELMVAERPTLQRQMAFAMGSALHGVVQTQMEMMGLVTPENIEVEYIIPDHHVRGRIDWITTHPTTKAPLVVEMKTRTVSRFAWQDAPEPSWIAQLNLALDSQDCDLGVLLMVEAGYPYRMTEFKVERDRELLDAIYAKFDRVRVAIEKNEPPRYCCGPGDKKIIDKCPARFQCWLRED
jgi:hypothetical protein